MTAIPPPSSTNSTPSNTEGATARLGGAEIRTGFSLPPSIVFGYTLWCAMVVVVESAPVWLFVTEVSTMIVVGIALSVVGIGFFCWLLFTLTVYALPFFAGMTAGFAAFRSGSGVIGALIVGVLIGGATLAIGQIVFATARTPLLRAVIGLLYAVPATIAGYHASLGPAHIGVPSGGWHEAFAVVGAVLIGGTAWARMSLLVPPNVGQDIAAGSAYLPFTASSKDG
jgi:hypothetical protein